MNIRLWGEPVHASIEEASFKHVVISSVILYWDLNNSYMCMIHTLATHSQGAHLHQSKYSPSAIAICNELSYIIIYLSVVCCTRL